MFQNKQRTLDALLTKKSLLLRRYRRIKIANLYCLLSRYFCVNLILIQNELLKRTGQIAILTTKLLTNRQKNFSMCLSVTFFVYIKKNPF